MKMSSTVLVAELLNTKTRTLSYGIVDTSNPNHINVVYTVPSSALNVSGTKVEDELAAVYGEGYTARYNGIAQNVPIQILTMFEGQVTAFHNFTVSRDSETKLRSNRRPGFL